MTLNTLQTPAYKEIMYKNITDTINYLFANSTEFGIVCKLEHTSFSPKLPQEIIDKFGKEILFVLGGYAFETASIEDDYFSFKAGFGESNTEALVTLPILAIQYIYLSDIQILTNVAKPTGEGTNQNKSTLSMIDILSSPENQRLKQKK